MIRLLRPFLLLVGITTLVVVYVVVFPVYFIALRSKKYWPMLYVLTAYLAKTWLLCSGIRTRLYYEEELKRSENYVFCANHTSYLDVPSVLIHKAPICFVGKSALDRIPLFGYMYRRMHISINREHLRSKYSALDRAEQRLREGVSVCFFPEGGIRSKTPPRMVKFQVGAFRVAIQAKRPIVPVAILYNWMILPQFRVTPFPKPYRHQAVLIFHKPIPTQELTLDQTHTLCADTQQVIENTLRTHFPYRFSSTT